MCNSSQLQALRMLAPKSRSCRPDGRTAIALCFGRFARTYSISSSVGRSIKDSSNADTHNSSRVFTDVMAAVLVAFVFKITVLIRTTLLDSVLIDTHCSQAHCW
ncbi:hypothetical protein PC129_g1723 [Phytophthora cactorum]|uniref:Uncharacterized protein n=1 Tax=Phytophthora cactorum TaxID=29920 RepID=A0A8T1E4E2_9STRA|nr:hypothetical protein Pcac1_g7573 [Phytophthora cactorum]KAG2880842.1 hypothetical protein PC114_g21873 [Phytophthora cactorum]KAG2932308.1 hypothetical protein PC115_g5851 [Phytophthora cactorum]KAG2949168.1 hypothetical protein PC117_g5496 [Phytophthora cactorum]KAG2992015.1 hypothetical protein PC118_g4789 [Phytophthora cactorum]